MPTQADSDYTVLASSFQSPNIKIKREATTVITELLKMKCKKEELVEIIQAGGKNGQISAVHRNYFMDN